MAITEEVRHGIYEAFRGSFGPKVANGIMELLPPVGWADVATKHDLRALGERIDARFDAIDARFGAVDARFDAIDARFGAVDGQFAELEERIDLRFSAASYRASALESRLGERIESMRADVERALHRQTRTFVRSLAGVATIAVAAAGALSGLS